MRDITDEQIEAAREIDLLTYLQQYEPDAIRKSGRNEYCLVEHDSLKISNGKWFWFSRGFGSATALDFLIQVRGMEFKEAVKTLVEGRAGLAPRSDAKAPAVPKVKPTFILPKANRCGTHSISYLQKRGIDSDIILRCIREGRFYEEQGSHKCVFVGYDKNNKARFACLRGYNDRMVQDKNGKEKLVKDMKDITGSDKRFSFTVPTRHPLGRSLLVFESPIDALSQATLDKQSEIGAAWDCFQRLSLGGLSSAPLVQYLKDHPEVDCISLCLDNDGPGQEASAKIYDMIKDMPHPLYGEYNVSITPPVSGKDYNDILKAAIRERQKTPSRQKAAISKRNFVSL